MVIALLRNPQTLPRLLSRHSSLFLSLLRRRIAERYRETWLGLAWAWIAPLLLLGAYVLVFGVLFSPRVATGAHPDRLADFALMLYSGVLLHGLLADSLTQAPACIVSNSNFVKKVVFPLGLLPLVQVGSATIHLALGLVILVLAAGMLGTGGFQATMLLLPFTVAPLVLLCCGISWALAALAVYIRDIGQLSSFLSTLLMFLSPVFFPLAAAPEGLRSVVALGPLAAPIEATREVLLQGRAPDWGSLGIYSVAALLTALGGLTLFRRSRRGFADVL